MKKVLIAILLAIPLIIIATINVSGLLISSTLKIDIEKIYFRDVEGTVEIDVADYPVGKPYKLEPISLPTIAAKDFYWKTSNPSIATVEDGFVYFTSAAFGDVKIYCYSRSNNNVFAVATFNVFGSKVISIDILEYGSEDSQDAYTLAVGDSMLLTRSVVPSVAIKDKVTTWSSNNTSVLSVDASGCITAHAVGNAVVTATVQEEDGPVTDSVTVSVSTSDALVTTDRISVAGGSIDLSAYTSGTLSVVSGTATLSGSVLSQPSGSGVTVIRSSAGEDFDLISVNFTAGQRILEFENFELLSDTIWSGGAYVCIGVRTITLRAVVANVDVSDAPVITYTSSNNALATFTGGEIIGLSGGEVTLTASAEGYTPCSVTLDVKAPMRSLYLALDNDNDVNRGIEGTVVFGDKFAIRDEYGAISYTNTYQLEVESYLPADADPLFEYVSSNPAYATVDSTGLITFHEAAIGNDVTIIVRAAYTFSSPSASDYYTFSVIDAVNIGYDVDPALNNTENPDFTIFEIVDYYLSSDWGWNEEAQYHLPISTHLENVVLHTDIFFPSTEYDTELGGIAGKNLIPYRNLYGNGYTLDGRFYSDQAKRMLYYDVGLRNTTIELRNITINASTPPQDENDWSYLQEYGGYAISIQLWEDCFELNKAVSLKYVTVQNTFNSTVCHSGKVTIDGCLYKNTLSAAVMMSTGSDRNLDITVRNTIISNTAAPAILIVPAFASSGDDQNNGSTLNLEGEVYIYNWKKIKDLSLDIIPPNALGTSLASLVGTLNSKINESFQIIVAGEEFDYVKVRSTETGALRSDDFVNLGIFSLGVWQTPAINKVNYDPTRFTSIETSLEGTSLEAFKEKIILYTGLRAVDRQGNPTGDFNTMPGEDYATRSDADGNPLYLKLLRGEA